MYNQYQLKDYGNDKNLIIQLVNMSCFIGVKSLTSPKCVPKHNTSLDVISYL